MLVAAADWFHAQRLDSVKGPFAQAQLVNVRRRRAFGANVDVVGVINQIAETGMGFQFRAARQVHGMR